MRWPPAISRRVLGRIPAAHREECCQQAWLAWGEQRNPATAVRAWLLRMQRTARRERLFSQLVRLPRPVCEQLGDDAAAFRSFG